MKKLAKIMVLCVLFVNVAQTVFAGFDGNHANYEAVMYLKDRGIMVGYDDGTMRPDNPINRAEFLKMALELKFDNNFDELDLTGMNNCFTDVKEEWFAKYVCFAKDSRIVQGYDDGSFKPEQEIVFTEAAKIINNVFYGVSQGMGYTYWYSEYINNMTYYRLAPLSIESLEHVVTRGEMAEMLWRVVEGKGDFKSFSYNKDKIGYDIRDGFMEANNLTTDGVNIFVDDKLMPEIDLDTFEYLSEPQSVYYYFKDKNAVYYYGYNNLVTVEGADPETFEVLNRFIAIDSDNLYARGQIKEGFDPDNIEIINDVVLTHGDEVIYYIDHQYEGTLNVIDGATPGTYQPLPEGFGKDENNVYQFYNRLEGEDPEELQVYQGFAKVGDRVICNTIGFDVEPGSDFEVIEDYFIFTNGKVYQGCYELEWADPGSFRVIQMLFDKYLIDDEHVYYTAPMAGFVEGADPATFEKIDDYYAKDAANIYFETQKLEVDYDSFESLGGAAAKDKNGLYIMGNKCEKGFDCFYSE